MNASPPRQPPGPGPDRLLATSSSAAGFYRRTGWILVAFGSILAVLPLILVDVDAEGRWVAEGIAAVVLLLGAFRLWKAPRAHPQARVHASLHTAPPDVRRAVLRRYGPVFGAAYVAVCAWQAYSLHELEAGRAASAEVYWPVGPVYEALGFWPAALVLPVIGVAAFALLPAYWRLLDRRG